MLMTEDKDLIISKLEKIDLIEELTNNLNSEKAKLFEVSKVLAKAYPYLRMLESFEEDEDGAGSNSTSVERLLEFCNQFKSALREIKRAIYPKQ